MWDDCIFFCNQQANGACAFRISVEKPICDFEEESNASVVQSYQNNGVDIVADVFVFVAVYIEYLGIEGGVDFFVVIIYFADIGK